MGKLAYQERHGMANTSVVVTSLCLSKWNDDNPELSTSTTALSQGPNDNTKEILTSHISLPTTSTTEKKRIHTKETASIIDHSLYKPIAKNTTIPQSTIQTTS